MRTESLCPEGVVGNEEITRIWLKHTKNMWINGSNDSSAASNRFHDMVGRKKQRWSSKTNDAKQCACVCVYAWPHKSETMTTIYLPVQIAQSIPIPDPLYEGWNTVSPGSQSLISILTRSWTYPGRLMLFSQGDYATENAVCPAETGKNQIMGISWTNSQNHHVITTK